MYHELLEASKQTLTMVLLAGSFTLLLGVPLGILLASTDEDHYLSKPFVHFLLKILVYIPKQTPYLIWMILLIPITHAITHGHWRPYMEAVIPLTLAGIPLLAISIQQATKAIPKGLVQTALCYGASHWQIITHIYLTEAKAPLVKAITQTLIALIGFSTIAGALGAGGLGQYALQHSQTNFEWLPILSALLILLVMIQIIHLIHRLSVPKFHH